MLPCLSASILATVCILHVHAIDTPLNPPSPTSTSGLGHWIAAGLDSLSSEGLSTKSTKPWRFANSSIGISTVDNSTRSAALNTVVQPASTGLGTISPSHVSHPTSLASSNSVNATSPTSASTPVHSILGTGSAGTGHISSISNFSKTNTLAGWQQCQASWESWSRAYNGSSVKISATATTVEYDTHSSHTVPVEITLGIADVFTTKYGYPYAKGNFTPTSTSTSYT
ncbi:hypothetical protein K431DRAFT_295684 [Polychaeton citri CBS 116435]|uniref:Uncharacterized protein n=1 Tax=Polychaeton citri CBS 116435 TaxID=1314669 RepID=A0A9P4Q5C0_9PEZI|nr:hypothetical protein K431DRAFT_295684 [Polychaeton citri CBS 116435]